MKRRDFFTDEPVEFGSDETMRAAVGPLGRGEYFASGNAGTMTNMPSRLSLASGGMQPVFERSTDVARMGNGTVPAGLVGGQTDRYADLRRYLPTASTATLMRTRAALDNPNQFSPQERAAILVPIQQGRAKEARAQAIQEAHARDLELKTAAPTIEAKKDITVANVHEAGETERAQMQYDSAENVAHIQAEAKKWITTEKGTQAYEQAKRAADADAAAAKAQGKNILSPEYDKMMADKLAAAAAEAKQKGDIETESQLRAAAINAAMAAAGEQFQLAGNLKGAERAAAMKAAMDGLNASIAKIQGKEEARAEVPSPAPAAPVQGAQAGAAGGEADANANGVPDAEEARHNAILGFIQKYEALPDGDPQKTAFLAKYDKAKIELAALRAKYKAGLAGGE